MTGYRLRQLVPGRLKKAGRKLTHLWIFSDLKSLRAYWDLESHCARGDAKQERIGFRVRPLGHQMVCLRTNSTDDRVLFGTFYHQFHLPPPDAVPAEAAAILDLGANIGLTMAHLAYRYARATVVGVELDAGNAELARANTAAWGERCRVIEGAVWPEDTEVSYHYRPGIEDGLSVAAGAAPADGAVRKVKAISLNTLVETFPGRQRVDYVKMDVEGAERDLLRRNTEWAARVGCIKVEVHGDYTPADCAADLERLGFAARRDTAHPLCVVGGRSGGPDRQGP